MWAYYEHPSFSTLNVSMFTQVVDINKHCGLVKEWFKTVLTLKTCLENEVLIALCDSDVLFLLQKCEFNMDNLSKPELLTLLSIMEGELEARDLVIEALRVSPDNTDALLRSSAEPPPPY